MPFLVKMISFGQNIIFDEIFWVKITTFIKYFQEDPDKAWIRITYYECNNKRMNYDSNRDNVDLFFDEMNRPQERVIFTRSSKNSKIMILSRNSESSNFKNSGVVFRRFVINSGIRFRVLKNSNFWNLDSKS